MRRSSRVCLLALLLAALAGCGGDSGASGAASSVVDLKGEEPFVNSLAVDPADGAYLLTTNRGFFRIPPDGGEAERVRGQVQAPSGSSPVGSFLEITAVGPGELVGSGHPDDEQALPAYLGFLRSNDAGRTWAVVSGLGEVDLHQIQLRHGRLYAYDAVGGGFVISQDGGRSWEERSAPPEAVVDFAVHPSDADTLVATTEGQVFRSTDRGGTWRPIDQGRSPALAWPAPDRLVRTDADGSVQVSSDGGDGWEPVGRIDGEPLRLLATGRDGLAAALKDGTILASRDGGRTWQTRFEP